MDSSDSDDDCYGNIALKLQRMKNKYTEDKIESTNLLNESSELDEIVKKAGKSIESGLKSDGKVKKSNASSDNDETDAITAVSEITTITKRVTRNSAKRANSEVSSTESPRPKKANRRKNTSEVSNTASDSSRTTENANTTETSQNSQTRGRSRGRGRNRGRNSRQNVINAWANIPTYSVGNTDEYPDQSDNQQLFSTKKTTNDVVIVEDNEIIDENEELSVKVYWQSSEFFKFKIRQFQKLTQIFDYFAKKENVSHDKLLFTFKDRILKPDDTPDSIGYSIVKFIDGGIVHQSVSKLVTNDKKERGGLNIKFQCQNVKKPFETTISPDEKLSVAMMKCAEHYEITLDKLRFNFDGDAISGKNTASDLELEGGECIDIIIIS